MARAERTVPEPHPRRTRSHDAWYGRAFGIDVEAAFPIPQLPAGKHERSRPRTSLEPAGAAELRRAWPSRATVKLVNRTFPDGSPMMVVEHHEDAGYCIWAPRYGRHLVSNDGVRVRCALPAGPAWRWERLLFAQVLPLAAALCGRELFHASAVALDGFVLAFVGQPGAGKSSVAAHLVARGASFVTDDVLALEPTGRMVLAYPGTSLAGIDTRELATMSTSGRARLGARLGRSDKAYLAAPVVEGPLPLHALYFLARGSRRSIEIGPAQLTPSRLLGSAFITYLRSERHLVQHLDACARIAAAVPTLEVSAPASVPAEEVAAVVEAHARDALAAR
jgi:hypothetical protein